MSIGPGDLSVGKMVCDTIKNIIHGMMVFPTKMVTPILDEQDLLVSLLLLRVRFRHYSISIRYSRFDQVGRSDRTSVHAMINYS